jgi:hypothetical protein
MSWQSGKARLEIGMVRKVSRVRGVRKIKYT